MHVARYPALLCSLLAFGACAGQNDPPALPDHQRFVPPAVTLPTPPEPQDFLGEAVKVAPLVTLPPPEAVPLVFEPRRRHGKRLSRDPITTAERGSLLTPNHGGYAQSTSALLRYPYRIGAVYLITVGVTHPVTLLLPPGLKLASPPALDPAAWDVGFAELGKEEERQEAVIIRPASAGVEATTPLLTRSGQMFLIRLKSQETAGVLACTWELPTVQVLTPPSTAAQVPKGPTIDLARLHTQYKIEPGKGAVSWIPAEVYDDGNFTALRWPESLSYTSAPILMAVSADGQKTIPLEYTTYSVPGRPEKGLFYITRGIYPRLQLRDGSGGVVTIIRQPLPAPIYTEVPHP